MFDLFYISKKYDVTHIESKLRIFIQDTLKTVSGDVYWYYLKLQSLDEDELRNEAYKVMGT